jgi:hypothetical protein
VCEAHFQPLKMAISQNLSSNLSFGLVSGQYSTK